MARRHRTPLSALTLVSLALPLLALPGHASAAPPVNSCGEEGFDPAVEPPDPGAPQLPRIDIPPVVKIPLPYPEIVPVPVPGREPDVTRVPQDPLPADPCADPCPVPGLAPDAPDALSSGSSGSSGSAGSSGSPGSSGSSSFLPRVELDPQPETIPIPVPGPPGAPVPPAPTREDPPFEPGTVTARPPAPVVGDVELISQLTGPGSENRTDARWAVHGTDLGIAWETRPGEVALAFGDTFGAQWSPPGGAGGDWRSNVLAFSRDADLSDGLTIDAMVQDSPCHAAEILDARHVKNFETTVIPTSGFAIGDRQYLSYMSVRRWSVVPGMWYTNHGGIAYSDDHGQTWVKDPHARWDNVFGLGRFQVATMVPHGDHVYMFGTPNGRIGSVGLARVPVDDVLNPSAYQYWVHDRWMPVFEQLATPLADGAASELSVRFDAARDRWQMSYLDPIAGNIVLRESDSPQGHWSDATPLVRTADYPKAYGGFMHPWSDGRDLYFTVSEWDSYNVYLMRARLD
ncbi:hypothetical protein Rruber_04781 [Rhodococcus ruber]|uniref:DUF4185 domain-containing protein n=1 Tax=Rhodococcus ruber TaxID=1830 RepID=UPI00315C59ED